MLYRNNEDKWPYYAVTDNKGMEVEVVTDLEEEPVTLAQAKEYMRIDTTDHDAIIPGLITTARQMLEKYSGYSFGAKELKLYLDEYTGKRMALPYGPVDTVDVVTLDGEDGTLDDHYELTANKKIKVLSGYQNLEIEYTTKAAVQEWMKTAVKQQVAFMFEHRGDEQGSHICEAAMTTISHFMVLNVF